MILIFVSWCWKRKLHVIKEVTWQPLVAGGKCVLPIKLAQLLGEIRLQRGIQWYTKLLLFTWKLPTYSSNTIDHQMWPAIRGLLGSMFLQPAVLPLALVVVLSVVLSVVLLSSPFPYWMILLRSQTEMPSLSQSLYHGSLITGEQPKVCSTVSSPPPRCFQTASPILGPRRDIPESSVAPSVRHNPKLL